MFADTAAECGAFSAAFDVCAFHASQVIFVFFKQTGGNGMIAVLRLGLAPIKIDAKMRATRTAGQTRTRSLSRH
jgi:hypothetical protein